MTVPQSVFEIVGEEAITELVAGFYQQIPNDPILGPMYPEDDWEGSEQRLRDFLIYRFGGPQRYIQERGHPRLRMRHVKFPINKPARDRWIELMNNAFEKVDMPELGKVEMKKLFDHVATFLINRQ
ncbi:MAG: globin [Planctomycetota bacterium]|nr:globin [Planctomycetota bacterium]